MGTAAQMVAKAASQIGYKESPAGSNKVKYWDWYDPSYQGQPWCDCFVSWCGAQIGETDAVGKFAYTPYHASFFKKRGRWIGRNGTPITGDIVFFARNGTICHVGIVTGRSGDKVLTIEGNTSQSGSQDNGGIVCRKERALGTEGSSWYIAGYGRPDYSGGAMGWHKDSRGWWYRRADGTYPKSEWEKLNGKWYYFDSRGYMLTGWIKLKGSWYYLNPKGDMRTGWLKDKGSWYWLDANGAMVSSCFKQINGKWYGFKKNGAMVTATDQLTIDAKGAIGL